MEHSVANPSPTVQDHTKGFSAPVGEVTDLGRYSVLLQAAGLGIPLILLCAPTFADLVNLWWTGYGFSYGFFVPLVGLYFAWLQRPTLQHISATPALGPGYLWLLIATLLLLASQAGSVITIGSVALILVIAGLVLLLCGYGYLKALAFPIAYLIFMTPALGIVTGQLEWPFQLLTASMSVSILQALGIPVLLENSIYINLPTVTLEVAPQCSGAGLLSAVLALGLPLAYLTLQAWWSRITLVVSSVTIAIVANWIRVATMGVYAQLGGKDLHGPYHILQGLFVDWVAFAFLLVGAGLLRRLEKAAPTPAVPRKQQTLRGFPSNSAARNRAWWLGSLTLAAAVLFLYSLDRGATEQKKDLATFPAAIGDWVIDQTEKEESLIGLQDVDKSLTRTYRGPDGRQVHLHIAYMKAQQQGKELVGLTTAALHERATAIDLKIRTVSLPANRTFIEKSHRPLPTVFWYHINGMSYADRSLAKLATVKQAFQHRRTDGALVLVSAELQPDQSNEQWRAQEEFAGLVFPLLQEYFP